MKKMDYQAMTWPTVEQLEKELKRDRKQRGRRYFLKSLCAVLILAALAALAVAFVWMPVLHINGESMSPTLHDGEIVAAINDDEIERGDIIAFYYNNKLLVKRVIAVGGDTINVDLLGNVSINGARVSEPYVSNRTQGDCDVDMPFEVPEGYLFVMGDNRSGSLDSRSTPIGCVAKEQVLGRVFARLWPLDQLQWIES